MKDKLIRDVLNNINKSLGLLSDKGILKLLNKLGVDADGNISNDLFYDTLLEEAEKAGMPETVLESLRKKLPIDLLADRKWIYQRLISLVNKHGIDLKLPGNQLVQQSGFGLGNLDSTYKDKSNNLRFLFNDEGDIKGVEAAVSVQVFRSVIPNYAKKSFEEKVDWLNSNKGVLEGLGYRIPTQGQNSTVPITVAQFLPENVGDVIVLPNEFTALTGSDFDIDKLFFVRYNYTTDKEGVAHKVAMSTGTTTIPFDNTIPQITEGFQVMSLAFTPKKANSKLKIEVVTNQAASVATVVATAVFRDSTASAIASALGTFQAAADGTTINTCIAYIDAVSTAVTTFTVRIGSQNAGTTTFNGAVGTQRYGGSLASSITIEEIAQ